METRLRNLFALQQVDTQLDELHELKGDLPKLVADLEERIRAKEEARQSLEESVRASLVRRDEIDVEIISLKEKIEKYKEQQFQIKTNKQYDALSREIDTAQEKIINLQKEMEILEGRAEVAKVDAQKLTPEIEELKKDLAERRQELELVNKEHEEEELKLHHEREKLVVRIDKNDLQTYERIRRAKAGKAVVPVRRNACGGCYKRIPPQTVLELRKNSRIIICEHCGRILVSDEIVEDVSAGS
ncbi:MAG TPA: C4-type zinc ribbon domain-containing protein [Bacteroidota bacterium]|nr:C4-type zinc ribbon domain-containing protein [Bacteroidota bacterium]